MAESEDLDLDTKPASNKKTIIIMAIVGVLLIGASVGLTVWLVSDKGEGSDEDAEETVKQAHYMPLDTLLVNFADSSRARYLQVDVQLMAHDKAVLQEVEAHMPVIRNDILVLMGGYGYEQVSSREGKEQLRQEVLATVNTILKQQAGLEGEGVQAVYFTNFVMQ
ncbi:MAG: flagellar basal body-associated FliL family protein [Pseudomonadota bacterium]